MDGAAQALSHQRRLEMSGTYDLGLAVNGDDAFLPRKWVARGGAARSTAAAATLGGAVGPTTTTPAVTVGEGPADHAAAAAVAAVGDACASAGVGASAGATAGAGAGGGAGSAAAPLRRAVKEVSFAELRAQVRCQRPHPCVCAWWSMFVRSYGALRVRVRGVGVDVCWGLRVFCARVDTRRVLRPWASVCSVPPHL